MENSFFYSDADIFTWLKLSYHPNEKKCTSQQVLQNNSTLGLLQNWRGEAKLFLFYLFLILRAFLQNDLFWSWARCSSNNVQGVEHNLWIENSDSGIFEDTQCLIQEIASKYAYHACDKQRRLLYK